MKRTFTFFLLNILLLAAASFARAQDQRGPVRSPHLGSDHFQNNRLVPHSAHSKNRNAFSFGVRSGPFSSGYFALTADVKQFHYSSRDALVTVRLPYSISDNTGNSKTDSVFKGNCTIEKEKDHPEFRILLGTEFSFKKGPGFDLAFSVSNTLHPYGRYINFDLFKFGMHYDLALLEKNHTPRLLVYPYLGYLRRDRDYNAGNIFLPEDHSLSVGGKHVTASAGEAGVVFVDMERMLQVGGGFWYTPATHFTGSSASFLLPRISLHLLVTYDVPIGFYQRIYMTNSSYDYYYRWFGDRYAKDWVSVSGQGALHRFDGISVSAGLVFCLGR